MIGRPSHVTPDKSWRRRLAGAAAALLLPALLFLLLLQGFEAPPRLAARMAETIFLLPRPRPAINPIIIDARGEARARPIAPASPAPITPGTPNPPAEPPPYAQPPGDAALTAALRRALSCRPDEYGRLSPLPSCQTPNPVMRDAPALGNVPSGVQNEARWAAEKQKRGNERVEVSPGISVGPGGPGVSLVIVDPLCRLTGLFFSGLHCGPPPTNKNPATEAQFKAALEAYQRRHGGGPRPALTSAAEQGKKDAENGNSPGPGAADNGPGMEPGR
jgi:hypothetical protein